MAFACLVAGLALAVMSGCHDAMNLDPNTGRPVGPDQAEPIDAAPDDAYESPRRDADTSDAPVIDAAVATIDAGMGGVDEAVCNACEAQSCRDVDGLDLYAACFLATDPATAGPGAGTAKAELCKAVLHCARTTGCAATDPQPCYCGEGVSDILCLAGHAAGPCKDVIEVAAESTSSAVIAERLADPGYALGAAFNLLRYCEAPICGAKCSGGSVDHPDAGVLPGPPDAAVPGPPDAAVPGPPDAAVTSPDAAVGNALLQNGRFDHDTSSWNPEFGATATWDSAHDAPASPVSGSMVVTNGIIVATQGSTMTGASQCVAAVAGATYHVSAMSLLAPGQGAGAAGINVQFFPSGDCSGLVSGAWTSPLTDGTAGWMTIAGSFAVPAATGSMRVRLVVEKAFTAPAFRASFDNVLLEKP